MEVPPLTKMELNLKPFCQDLLMHPRLLSWKYLVPSCQSSGGQRGGQALECPVSSHGETISFPPTRVLWGCHNNPSYKDTVCCIRAHMTS